MLFLKRIKFAILERKIAKAWRKQTGGTCRYSFRLGGGTMTFSGNECETEEELAELLRVMADMLVAPKTEVTNL